MSDDPAEQAFWRQMDETLSLESPTLQRLSALWEENRGPRLLPGRSDFTMDELIRFDGMVCLIDVEYDPIRFRFRLIGTHITNILGRDSTGRYLDDLYSPDHYDIAAQSYLHCVEKKRPIRAFGSMVHANKEHLQFETIDMPLAQDGHKVDMILKGADYGLNFS